MSSGSRLDCKFCNFGKNSEVNKKFEIVSCRTEIGVEVSKKFDNSESVLD